MNLYTLKSLFCCRPLTVIVIVLAVTLLPDSLNAQFKKKQNPYYYNYPQIFLSPDELAERLRQTWLIVQAANNDDPSAQLALAARYLTGEGFEPDTVKALYWLKRSESLGNLLASYNLALFYYNGWGVPWNPYTAYEYFEKAAKGGIHFAEYALGQLLIENLIVPKNPQLAKQYLQKAAQGGEDDAVRVLEEYTRKGYFNDTITITQHTKETTESKSPLVFIDFRPDTNRVQPDDKTLITDFYHESSLDTLKTKIPDKIETAAVKSDALLEKYMRAGSPEGFVFTGRLYETGKGRKKDIVKAAAHYIRAIRYDSPRAGYFLNELLKNEQFMNRITGGVKRGDAECLFVYSAVALLNNNSKLSEKESYDVLKKAASLEYIPAEIELGRALFTGAYGEKNREAAFALWRRGKTNEGDILSLCYSVIDKPEQVTASLVQQLNEAADEGSIIALVTFGYTLENGLGGKQDKAAAERIYRKAASRGSKTGYFALLRLYDSLRPSSPKFTVPDEMSTR